MSSIPFDNPVSPELARLHAEAETQARKKAEAKARAQRWAIPLALRGPIIKVALGLCGIETDHEGHVKRTNEDPPPKPREKLAAMRVLATYDKISIDERKLELTEKAAGIGCDRPNVEMPKISPDVATECLMLLIDAPPRPKPKPAPPPENQAELEMAAGLLNARWPLSVDVRGAIIETAANLCGLAITDEATIELIPVTDETPAPKPRFKLGALRVLARFDRLSLEHRRGRLLAVRLRRKQRPEPVRPDIDPETAAKFMALIEEDLRRQRE
jgi:hypothetical protein